MKEEGSEKERRRREDKLRKSRAEKKREKGRKGQRGRGQEGREEEREAEERGGEPVEKDVTGWTEVNEEQEEEDGPDICQDGWNENGGDGGVARRQGPEDPEHCEWK